MLENGPDLCYARMSINTYATCALEQFTEDEEDGDRETRDLAVFCV